jgi:MSHA biogenesis protein MshP
MMQKKSPQSQQGLSLIIVVFILVALSILASAMVQVLTASSEAVAREVLSARAFMAAESGAQRLLNEISSLDKTACADNNNVYKEHTFTDFSALQGCGNVVVNCKYIEDVPVGSSDIYYTINSAGKCGPIGEEASRKIELQAKNI